MIKTYFLILGSVVNIFAGGFVFWIPLVDPSAKVVRWSAVESSGTLSFFEKVTMTADYFGYSGIWSMVNIVLLLAIIAVLIASVFKMFVSPRMLLLFLSVKFVISLLLLVFLGDYFVYAIVVWLFQLPLDVELYRLFRSRAGLYEE